MGIPRFMTWVRGTAPQSFSIFISQRGHAPIIPPPQATPASTPTSASAASPPATLPTSGATSSPAPITASKTPTPTPSGGAPPVSSGTSNVTVCTPEPENREPLPCGCRYISTLPSPEAFHFPPPTHKITPGPVIDNLYLDVNCLIHSCTSAVQSVQNSKGTPIQTDDFEAEVIKELLNRIDRIVHDTKPKQLLFLSLDGVPPAAKITQQRERRFKSWMNPELPASVTPSQAPTQPQQPGQVQRLPQPQQPPQVQQLPQSNPSASANSLWDSNAITPGTRFMTRLSLSVRKFVEHRISNGCTLCASSSTTGPKFSRCTLWSVLTVIVSDSTMPGEGEQKIIDFIRYQRDQHKAASSSTQTNSPPAESTATDKPSQQHYIYSMDSDLVLLCMTLHELNLNLLWTEDDFNTYTYLDIKSVQSTIMQLIGSFSGTVFNDTAILSDWILLTCLLGNDFIPGIPSLWLGENALNRLTEQYSLAKHRGAITRLVDNGEINYSQVAIVLQDILVQEPNILEQREQQRCVSRNIPYTPKPFEATRSRHYCFNFPELDSQNPDVPIHVARSYWEGLTWVIKYIFKGCRSWEWIYPYHNGPFLVDLVGFLSLKTASPINTFTSPPGSPITPAELLLSVLPPSSANLLPKQMSSAFGETSILSRFWPNRFPRAVIPIVNMAEVKKQYLQLRASISSSSLVTYSTLSGFIFSSTMCPPPKESSPNPGKTIIKLGSLYGHFASLRDGSTPNTASCPHILELAFTML
ncbi:5'-3' exoribonuclease 2 [Pelomyxa schiedti]|nr:5'-3' exoribonuclease 2 [Pelomyxa schiedti]